MARRIAQRFLSGESGPRLILAEDIKNGDGVRCGFDVTGIGLLQFLGVFQNAPELRLKEFRLFLSEIESCESRDVRHVDVDRLGHGNRLKVEMAHEPEDGDTKRNHENQKDDPSFTPLLPH